MHGRTVKPLTDDLDADGTTLSKRASLVLKDLDQSLFEAESFLTEFLDAVEENRVWDMTSDGLQERVAAFLRREIP